MTRMTPDDVGNIIERTCPSSLQVESVTPSAVSKNITEMRRWQVNLHWDTRACSVQYFLLAFCKLMLQIAAGITFIRIWSDEERTSNSSLGRSSV